MCKKLSRKDFIAALVMYGFYKHSMGIEYPIRMTKEGCLVIVHKYKIVAFKPEASAGKMLDMDINALFTYYYSREKPTC